MSSLDAVRNLGRKAAMRLLSARKPLVRFSRRRARAQEQRAFGQDVARVDAEIARVAAGSAPIVAGPWLAEVGYEVLYWIPFLRWFCDAHGIRRERLVVLSRGGMHPLYDELAARYVDLFDLMPPEVLAARNGERRLRAEGGGQKQSSAGALDDELLDAARRRAGVERAAVLHPSLLFRLFRNVWYGNLPHDVLWRRTRYGLMSPAVDGVLPDLPPDFIAVKLYTGPALGSDGVACHRVRALVKQAATMAPVVLLETPAGLDEHRDFELGRIDGVVSARDLIAPRTNLSTQVAIIARSRLFLGTCGGLAWLAPFMGVPTVAVHDNDQLLGPHLLIARQAARSVGAAEFAPLDLRALGRIGLL